MPLPADLAGMPVSLSSFHMSLTLFSDAPLRLEGVPGSVRPAYGMGAGDCQGSFAGSSGWPCARCTGRVCPYWSPLARCPSSSSSPASPTNAASW